MRSANRPATTNSPELAPMEAARTLLANSVQYLVRYDQVDPNDADVRSALDSLGIALAALPIASGDYSMLKNRLEAIKQYRKIYEVGAMRWELMLLLHWLRSMGWIF